MRRIFGILFLVSLMAVAGTTRVRQNLMVIGQTTLGTESEPHSSAILDMSAASDYGVLLPRGTTTDRDAISSPGLGLFYFNTSTLVHNFHNGTSWNSYVTSAEVEDQKIILNMGLSVTTTTGTSDTIVINGKDGSALSSSNLMKFGIGASSAGQVTILSQSANVSIDITGAHWGLDTNGDFTDVELRLYGVNDGGTAKYCVGLKGGLRQITDTNTSTTGTSVTSKSTLLCNTALNSGTFHARELAYFHANFDDTGASPGAGDDDWQIQSAVGDLNVGVPVPDQTDWQSYTPGSTLSTNVTWTGRYRRDGQDLIGEVRAVFSGNTDSANLDFNLPSGLIMDTGAFALTPDSWTQFGICIFENSSGSVAYPGFVRYSTTISLRGTWFDATGTPTVRTNSTNLSPVTIDSSDDFTANFRVPILQWSGNGNGS